MLLTFVSVKTVVMLSTTEAFSCPLVVIEALNRKVLLATHLTAEESSMAPEVILQPVFLVEVAGTDVAVKELLCVHFLVQLHVGVLTRSVLAQVTFL